MLSMLEKYAGAKKTITGPSLLHKYKKDIREIYQIGLHFPGIKSMSKLPSRTTQLLQMKQPMIAELWKSINPVSSSKLSNYYIWGYQSALSFMHNLECGGGQLQKHGVELGKSHKHLVADPHAICSYMLCCTDNKDIFTHATDLPAGRTRKKVSLISLNQLVKLMLWQSLCIRSHRAMSSIC
jgi:hypothetical protein